MSDDVRDHVIIVTGGAGGIGHATAHVLARAGAQVVVADLPRSNGASTASEIVESGGRAWFEPVDVTREESVAGLVERTIERSGRLDGAFNNAGVEQNHKPLHKLSLGEWSRVIDVDLTGVFLCLKYEITAMLKCGGGSIVNTSSIFGQAAVANSSEYVAAKHGVVGLTRAAAIETAARGIRVNAILPGVIETSMIRRFETSPDFRGDMDAIRARHPIGRLGSPEEIAAVAAWLLSDQSSFVTGAAIVADGGYLAL